MLEENLAQAEGGDRCVCFATGMGAISGALGVLTKTGDRVISHPTLYGCTYSLFTNWYPRLGIDVDFVDLHDLDALEKAIEPMNTMVVYFETPVNPTLDLIDIGAIAEIVKRANEKRPDKKRRIFIVVDNTFATPVLPAPARPGRGCRRVHSLDEEHRRLRHRHGRRRHLRGAHLPGRAPLPEGLRRTALARSPRGPF